MIEQDVKKAKSGGDMIQDVLASMPVAVAWADRKEGRILFINRKFTSMFGYTLKDLGTVHEWVTRCYADPEQAMAIDKFWESKLNDDSGDKEELEDMELDILCKDGSIKTVLSGKILLPDHAGALSTFLDITPRKEKERLIRRQALEDPLTGLLNRRAFSLRMEECLQDCIDSGGSMALLLIDLDAFKPVNDTLGHDQGDLLLVQVAGRLRQAVREQDTLCRIGGDEFGVILSSAGNEAVASMVAERILYGLGRKSYEMLQGKAVEIGASIGMAFFPEDGNDELALFRHADQALYRAKNSGRGRWSR